MQSLGRRHLLRAAGAAALSAALVDGARARSEASASARRRLVPDPNGILDLPEGFRYEVIQRTGDIMTDGYRVPARPDGMGCFPGPNGTLVLLRNHENLVGDFASGPYRADRGAPPEAFDPRGTGGVTRLVVEASTGKLVSSNLALAGTYWNCAGGPSPWGWLSCEETLEPGHGYVFLCRPEVDSLTPAEPIKAYGRFRHEAATVVPGSHIAYLTEDRTDACFYRFVPDDAAEPFGAGKLQALAVAGAPGFATNDLQLGQRRAVEWVDVDEPNPNDDSVRLQAQEKGAATFVRGEGLWLTEREVYICATAGGPLGLGQIFRLQLEGAGTLELAAQADDPNLLNMPDNLVLSPHGQLYIAEDGYGENHLRRLSLDGRIVDFARNALSRSEFAGPCFAPDGNSMFVNMQEDGLTLRVTGPFEDELVNDHRESAAASLPADDVDCRRGGRGLGSGLAVLALAAMVRRRRALARK